MEAIDEFEVSYVEALCTVADAARLVRLREAAFRLDEPRIKWPEWATLCAALDALDKEAGT